ncbi:MAG: hypothetical protein KDD43_07580, partial [Bdellovibrionales bacterium]|nr:hypothetical protein [Bdellovibrionales bacterium]
AIQYLEEWKRGLKLDRPDIAQWMRQGAKIEKMSDPLLKPNHVRRARIKVLQSMALHQSLIPKQSMDWIYMAGYYDSLAGKMESPYLQRVLNSSDVSEGFKNQTRRLLQKMKARHRQSASSEFNSGRTQ